MRHHELILPDLGLDDQPIVAGLWLVAPGGKVLEGEALLEVLAGSALVDLPSPADGVLLEALVAEDEPLKPGQRLGIVASGGQGS